MNKKGQIDQTITSVVVIIGVVFLMVIFIIVSSNIGALFDKESVSQKPGSESDFNSRVLGDLFLSDEVEIENNKILVYDAFRILADKTAGKEIPYGVSDVEISKIIQEKFDKDYSCSENNFLQVKQVIGRSGDGSSGTTEALVKIHMDYPANKENLPLDVFSDSPTNKIEDFYYLPEGVYRKVISNGESSLIVFVKENVKC